MRSLHHLSNVDLTAAVREAHRVMAPGGVAIFLEPIEDSPAFEFIQTRCLPAEDREYYRPWILSRRKWVEYVAKLDNRTLTHAEMRRAGANFDGLRLLRLGC